jgi:hypothetical protein
MFDKMGLGWGNSLLGFVALATGIGFPIFLWVYVSFLNISGIISLIFLTQGPAVRAKGNSDR